MGIASTSALMRVWPVAVPAACGGTSAVTVRVSAWVATDMMASTRAVPADGTCTPSRVVGWKSSAVMTTV